MLEQLREKIKEVTRCCCLEELECMPDLLEECKRYAEALYRIRCEEKETNVD